MVKFTRQGFSKAVEKCAMLYDVQINTSGMSVEQAAQIVARAAQVLALHPDLPDSPPGPGH